MQTTIQQHNGTKKCAHGQKIKSIAQVACTSLLLCSLSQAEDTKILEKITTEDVSLDGVSWKSYDVKNNSGSRSILSNHQLTTTGQRTIDSALQNIPGIQIRDYSGTGILPKLEFRGFGGAGNGHSNTGLILLDGNNIYGAPYSNIELALFPISFLMVDHIDFIKGGQSVQYGPNTFSGVLNIISKPISEKWENIIAERITFWGKNGTHYSNNGDYSNNALYDTYLKTGGMITDSFGIDLQADIISGQSFRENSPTKVQNFTARAIYKVNPNNVFNAFFQYYNYAANDPGSLSTQQYFINRFANLRPYNMASGTAKRTGITYQYYFGEDEKFNGNLSVNYYFHDVLRNFQFDNNYNTLTTTNPTSISSNVREFQVHVLEPKMNINITKGIVKQNLVFGLRYTYEGIQQSTYTKTLATNAVSLSSGSTYFNNYLAAYLGDDISITKYFSINPGLRYEFIDADYTNPATGVSAEPRYQNQFNPAISMNIKPIDGLVIYTNYARSFLPPQITGDIAGQNFYRTSIFQNIEGGVRYSPNSIFSINANYFAIFADKYRLGNFVSDPNGANALSQGVELELYLSPFKGLDMHFAYTFTDARIRDHQISSSGADMYGKMLPYVSPHSFSFDITYDIPKIFTLGVSGYYYSKSYSDIANTVQESSDGKGGMQPDYFVLNAQIGRVLWQNEHQKITGSIAVNNIFNANYYFRGIGTSPVGRQSAPGRSVIFFISYAF